MSDVTDLVYSYTWTPTEERIPLAPYATPDELFPSWSIEGMSERTRWEDATSAQLTAIAAELAGQRYISTQTVHKSPDFWDDQITDVRASFVDGRGHIVASSTAARSAAAIEWTAGALARELADLKERQDAVLQVAAYRDLSSTRRLAHPTRLSHTQVGAVQRRPLNAYALQYLARDIIGDLGIPVDPGDFPPTPGVRIARHACGEVLIAASGWSSGGNPEQHRVAEDLATRAIEALTQVGIRPTSTRENSWTDTATTVTHIHYFFAATAPDSPS